MHAFKYRLPFLSVLVLTGFMQTTVAQKSIMKFGKIDENDLKMSVYDKDTNASAVVLGKEGYSLFLYSEDYGWQIQTTIHKRIKILKPQGLEFANDKIYLFESGMNKEDLLSLKGFTYNLVDGKVSKDKLANDAVFKEEIDDYNTAVKFTFPNVKPGSIIEVEYIVVSDFIFHLDPWYFQDEIPVAETQYTIEIPEDFRYKESSKGYEGYQRSVTGATRSFSFNYASQIDPGSQGGRTSGGRATFERRVYIQNYYASHVPAFISEPKMNNMWNYVTSIEFELTSFTPKYGLHKNFSNTWDNVKKTLLEETKFGMQLKGNGFLDEYAAEIAAKSSSDIDKAIRAYKLIQSKMAWSGYSRLLAKESLRTAFNNGAGNSADINLLLVALLRKLELEADPVILSTRSNGMIMPGQIMLSKFNYTIATVKIGGKSYLLDATDRNCMFNMLPVRCLNGEGRIISDESTDGIDLNSDQPYESLYYAELNLSEDNQLTGKVTESYRSYAAYESREAIKKETSIDDYVKKLEQKRKGIEITEFEAIDLDSIDKPLNCKYIGDFSGQITEAGDMLYFSPVVLEKIESNPFKLEERKYPVDFAYPNFTKLVLSIALPENYEVVELPKPVMFRLPDKSASFVYRISNMGDKINLYLELKINKSLFSYAEYPDLRMFYENVYSKHNEQVVLKKKI